MAVPAAPAGESLWADEVSGVGTQTLAWPTQAGKWSVVVMNADAAKGVRADVSIGAKVPLLLWLAIGLRRRGLAA